MKQDLRRHRRHRIHAEISMVNRVFCVIINGKSELKMKHIHTTNEDEKSRTVEDSSMHDHRQRMDHFD